MREAVFRFTLKIGESSSTVKKYQNVLSTMVFKKHHGSRDPTSPANNCDDLQRALQKVGQSGVRFSTDVSWHMFLAFIAQVISAADRHQARPPGTRKVGSSQAAYKLPRNACDPLRNISLDE